MERNTWTGWIGFAGCLMLVIGSIDAFEGLIAIIRGAYWGVTPNQIIVFSVKEWGWIMLFWGILVALIGLGLLSAASWARWAAVVVGTLSFIAQLGFIGSTPYPLWGLTVMGLTLVVLFALTVKWNEGTAGARV